MAQNRLFRDGHHIIRSQGPAYHSPSDGLSYRMVRLMSWLDGRTQMRNTAVFGFAPALIAIGFGVWAASPANAPASPSIVQGIEPLQMMVNAKELPTVEFVDYTFVFAD
jgi:hypothetical protein